MQKSEDVECFVVAEWLKKFNVRLKGQTSQSPVMYHPQVIRDILRRIEVRSTYGFSRKLSVDFSGVIGFKAEYLRELLAACGFGVWSRPIEELVVFTGIDKTLINAVKDSPLIEPELRQVAKADAERRKLKRLQKKRRKQRKQKEQREAARKHTQELKRREQIAKEEAKRKQQELQKEVDREAIEIEERKAAQLDEEARKILASKPYLTPSWT